MKRDQQSENSNQRNDQVSSNHKYLSKIANASSLLCSVTGIAILAAILFGPANILDYKHTKMASDCAYALLISAVLLWFLAIALAIFKKDLKQTDPDPAQREMSQNKLFEGNRKLKAASHNVENQPSENKITVTKCKDKSRRLAHAEGCSTAEEITKTSSNSSMNTLPHVELYGKPEIPIRNPKHSATSLYSKKDQSSVVGNQLVPVMRHQDTPSFGQSFIKEISTQVPNHGNYFSTEKLGNVTELVATRKVSYFKGGNIQRQEECQLKQTTIFRHPETGIPSFQVSELNFHPHNMEEFRRRCMPSHLLKEPRENQISDVIRKFESL